MQFAKGKAFFLSFLLVLVHKYASSWCLKGVFGQEVLFVF